METSGKAKRGRPRRFDHDTALTAAMKLFWERGYEATGVADLARVMALNPPSLYAAFGDKRQLFLASVELYLAQFGKPIADALAGGATAREAIAMSLDTAVSLYVLDDHPKGCMVVSAATNCSPDAREVAEVLAARREATRGAILERIKAGVRAGELPGGAAEDLANFYAATIYGLSNLARDGASRAALKGVVDRAMAAWPR